MPDVAPAAPETVPILPDELRPLDGRFGSGPSKVRQEAVEALARSAPGLLGTSHRRPAVKRQVGRVRAGLAAFFGLPDGYEVALGNGGATLFWDAATYGLVQRRSAHAVFGEFSRKFAAVTASAPHLADPVVVESQPGTHPVLEPADVDVYALTHCETSTGVAMAVERPAADGLVLVDATSAAGGLPVEPAAFDAYYFSPQKAFASEGGLWFALLSPAAIQRIEQIDASGRWTPPMLSLPIALDSSRKDQTYNTPSAAALFLMGEQIEWMNAQGGLAWAVRDCRSKSTLLYDWAERTSWATPFVQDPAQRSAVVCTIDLDESVPSDRLTAAMRANGVVDIEPYRKLGRNQIRVAVFPAVDRGDVELLLSSLEWVAERLAS